MAVFETWLKNDLKKPLNVEYLNGNIFSQDNQGNMIGVEVFDDGAEATLSGSVSANIIRADGSTVAQAGTLSGNKCSVVLPQTAYAVPGILTIVIKLTTSGVITTVAAAVATVYRSSTNTIVDPGTIIPSIQTLISQIEAAVADIPADYSSLLADLAPDYSQKTWHVGEYCWYNGDLKRCKTEITTAESYNSAHWESAVLGADLYAMRAELDAEKAVREQADNELKSALTNSNAMVVAEIGKDTGTKELSFAGIIATSGKWGSFSNGTHTLIPIAPGDTIYIKANSSKSTIYGILKEYSVAVEGQYPSYSDDANFNEKKTLSAGNETTIQSAPSDAYYLCLNNIYNSTNYMPQTLMINGYDAYVGVRKAIKNNTDYAGRILSIITNQSLASYTDLDSIIVPGYYRLALSGSYDHTPIGTNHRRLLIVNSSTLAGNTPYQIMIGFDTGEIHTRLYHDGAWDGWKIVNDVTAKKIALGMNQYRKATDHGGFYDIIGGVYMYQNSPLSFLKSAREGICYHNLDIVFSSDGVPFVVHNNTLTDINGVTFQVKQTTAENVKTHILGDDNYSWIPQTLKETDAYIKNLGGMIDMVDVSGSPVSANAQNLVDYYRANNIHPTWTNWDDPSIREAFSTAGPEFGVYIACSCWKNSALHMDDLTDAISYISNHTGPKYAVNIGTSNDTVLSAIESGTYIKQLATLGVKIYVYTYNAPDVRPVPQWADGAVSEKINVNYETWKLEI